MAGAKKPPTKKLFYEAVFKHSVEAIAILDCQGSIVEVNPAACKLFGATKKKLIGKSLDKVLKFPSNWQHLQGQGEIEIEQFEGQVKAVEYSQVRDLLPHYSLIVFRELNHVRLNALAQLNLHHQRVETFFRSYPKNSTNTTVKRNTANCCSRSTKNFTSRSRLNLPGFCQRDGNAD